MAVLSSGGRHALPDSAFAYIEPGHDGERVDGKTPDRYRHFPVHDAPHARNALARIGQGARFAAQARARVLAAAKKFGVHHDAAETGRSLETLYPEVRFLADVPEIRSMGDDGPPHIYGYAAAFNKLSRRLGGFVERVMPGAFDETLRSIEAADPAVNVVCRYNHKDDMLLGTTQAGTLTLSVDERGLYYDVLPPGCRSDVLEYVQRKDVRYSSFAFRCLNPGEDDSWGVTDYGFPMRSLHRVETLDVAPVTDPAYRDTTAMARNMSGAVESLAAWVDAEPAEVRSMLEAGQASRFFKRTDRPSALPKPEPAEERVMLDDPAIALRRWVLAPEPGEETRQETGDEGEAAERAMHGHDQMCKQYTHGEPCVLGAGHEGDHAQRCHAGQYDEHGLPCAKPQGHAGDHAPMSVDDGEPQRGPGRPRNRDGAEASGDEETRTMSAPEALAALAQLRANLVRLD